MRSALLPLLFTLVIVYKTMEGIRRRSLTLFLERARKAAGLPGEVNVILTSSAQMRALNREFRGKDRATDVLSFPAPSILAEQFSGDMAISVDIAQQNAVRYRHDLMQELKILLLHGVLHLAGHDHEQDSGLMARKEERLRQQLGLGKGLIARAGASRPAQRRGKPAATKPGLRSTALRSSPRNGRRGATPLRQAR